MFAEEAADGAGNGGSWWDSVVRSFTNQWWVFIVVLAVVLIVLTLVCILTRGKLLRFRTIIKIAINCVLGFVLLFVINFFGGLFTGGAWSLTPKWYSWIIIGVFGIIGLIFLIISAFAWPGMLVAAA